MKSPIEELGLHLAAIAAQGIHGDDSIRRRSERAQEVYLAFVLAEDRRVCDVCWRVIPTWVHETNSGTCHDCYPPYAIREKLL